MRKIKKYEYAVDLMLQVKLGKRIQTEKELSMPGSCKSAQRCGKERNVTHAIDQSNVAD